MLELLNLSKYEDRYDLYTIQHCQMIEQMYKEIGASKDFKQDMRDVKLYKIFSKMNLELRMYFEKGERWKSRETTIREWMSRDRTRDSLFNSAAPPNNIRCNTCNIIIQSDFKTLTEKNGQDVILFFYRCPNKHRGRAFYNDGTEFVPKTSVCSKCHGTSIEEKRTRDTNTITTIERCTSCHHEEIDIFDLDSKTENIMNEEEFERLRKQYCITDEAGQEYMDFQIKMVGIQKMLDKYKERDNNQTLYQLIDSIEQLTIPQLRKRIVAICERHQFTQLHFEQPVMSKDVQLSFIVQDESDKQKYDSVQTLTKLLKKELATTNWLLMSDGIKFRMGVLSGRFRGYEQKEEIKKLVTMRLKQNILQLPKIKRNLES